MDKSRQEAALGRRGRLRGREPPIWGVHRRHGGASGRSDAYPGRHSAQPSSEALRKRRSRCLFVWAARRAHDARRGAGLLLPRAAAAGDGRLNHLRDGTRAPSRSHQPAQRRPTARMAPEFRCVGFLCLDKPATCPPARQNLLPRPALYDIMLTRAWLVFGRARALVEPAGGRRRRCRRCRRRCKWPW